MMVKLKAKETGYVGRTMYFNPLNITVIKEHNNDAKKCYLRVTDFEKWLEVYEPADVVACKVADALEEML